MSRDDLRREACARKRRYSSWDAAEAAALLVWIENPSPFHQNPCAPYPCDLDGERHYHYGHAEGSVRWKRQRRKERQAA